MKNNLFRIEKKIPTTDFEANLFLNKLKYNNFKKKFEDRIIKSLYFENSYLNVFKNSEEGILPRKKIRLRNYPNTSDKNIYLEKKISSIEGRYKEVSKISKDEYQKFLNFGISDNIYGVIKPKIYVSYLRSYFENKFLRVTFDQNIKYRKFNNNTFFLDDFNVFEIKSKTNININSSFIDNFQIRRFSKYCNGIKKLNIN